MTEKHKRDVNVGDTLNDGYTLYSGQYLSSANGSYFLLMQTDGNLVLYISTNWVPINAMWSTRSWASSYQRPYRLMMQTDGNLVMYDNINRPVWASGTDNYGVKPHRLVLQDDGNLVLYDANNRKTWSTNTRRY